MSRPSADWTEALSLTEARAAARIERALRHEAEAYARRERAIAEDCESLLDYALRFAAPFCTGDGS